MKYSGKYPDRTSYELGLDSKSRQCVTCRKMIKSEPYAIRKYDWGCDRPIYELRCWRCWHGADITQLFMKEYPKAFERVKIGRWWYLTLSLHGWIFPSSLGEHELCD